MKRITLLAAAILIVATNLQAKSDNRPTKLYAFDQQYMESVKSKIEAGNFEHMEAYNTLIKTADEQLDAPISSVMDKTLTAPSGDKHDYMSMGPYWWPNPNTPDGLPYIRKDGVTNHDARNLDNAALGRMNKSVKFLALAYYFTKNEKYAAKAVKQLKAWYINPKTRMNPNMNYAQIVLGHNNNWGRGIGLIDKFQMVYMNDYLTMLRQSKHFKDKDYEAIKQWHREFLDWMLTSKNGKDERKTKNNHSTNYDSQVISYSIMTGKEDLAHAIISNFLRDRIYTQVEPDGSQPHELARTRALNYSNYNTSITISVCMQAKALGIDLFKEQSKDGRSVLKMLDYLAQYLGVDLKQFPYKNISKWDDAQRGLYVLIYWANYYFPERGYDKYLNRAKKYKIADHHLFWLTNCP